MNQPVLTNEYDALIKKIRRKKTAVLVTTIVALLVVLIACCPMHLSVLGKVVVDYKGASPVLAVFLILLVIFCELIVYSVVLLPLTTSLTLECDPQKHIALNTALNKQKNLEYILTADYIYLGKYDLALDRANKMVASNKPKVALSGLFNKARCEYFLGDFDSLRLTLDLYESRLAAANNMKPKVKEMYEKIKKVMQLMVAVSEKDKEKITACRNAPAWNTSKATQGCVDYFNGVAAYLLDEKTEAVYLLMRVKENCGKTVLAQLSEEYLAVLGDKT